MSLILRRPRVSQPQGSAVLDRGSALARGLLHAHNYTNPSGLDALGGAYAWTTPSDAVLTTKAAGLGIVTTGSNRQIFNPSRFAALNEAATFLWHFTMGTVGGLQGLLRGQGSARIALYVQADGTIREYSDQIGAFVGSATSTALVAGREYTVAFTHEAGSGGATSIYVNGVREVSGTTSTSSLDNSFFSWGDQFSQVLTGAKHQFFAWNRALSPPEIAYLHANKWALWAPLPRKLWAPTAAAGSHDATGGLSASAATIAGTASHLTLHTSSGALAAGPATIAGTTAHQHVAAGALAASAATIAGTAAHLTPHASSGALVAGSAAVAGAAARATVGTHPATGALVADAAAVAGTAAHLTLHAATGALVADAAVIAGSAAHVAAPVSHAASGALVAGSATISSSAAIGGTESIGSYGGQIGNGPHVQLRPWAARRPAAFALKPRIEPAQALPPLELPALELPALEQPAPAPVQITVPATFATARRMSHMCKPQILRIPGLTLQPSTRAARPSANWLLR